MFGCLLSLVSLAASAGPKENLTVLPEDSHPRMQLRTFLHAELQKHFDDRRQAVAALKTPEQILARQSALRKRMIELLGGFPERTPLKARTVDTIRQNGYLIEKVIYESRPGHHVTANLYLPPGKGPFPGVLMPIGHSGTGKAAEYIQRGAILLVKNGVAVLAYDPIGQGERRQLPDVKGKPALPGSTSEHTMVGVSALLVGWNTATFRIWDGMRGLDYLASRPEIDAKRLGCTGCSGGGTLTSYLMALDDRIVAAAPSCYLTTLERLFATIGPQDAEQNITGQVAAGIEHADYITMRATKPTLICAATKDFFDIQGTWTTFREAKRLYSLLGHSERIDLVESDTTHGFPRTQREAMLRWMLRWLAGRDVAPKEEDFPILPVDKLHCTRTGQVLEDLAGISAFGLCAKRAQELGEKRKAAYASESSEQFQTRVAKVIGVTLPVKPATRRELDIVKREGYQIRKLTFETDPGIRLPALLFSRNAGDKEQLVIYLHGENKVFDAEPAGPIEKLMKTGHRVLALDVRGIGELAPSLKPAGWTSYFGVETRETFLSLHLARPLLGQRVHDVLAVLGSLVSSSEKVAIVGIGKAGPIAMHAALLDPRINHVTVKNMLVSWQDVVQQGISNDQFAGAVPGVLAHYDLPELAAHLAPRLLVIDSLVDGKNRPISTRVLPSSWQIAQDRYTKAKASEKIILRSPEK